MNASASIHAHGMSGLERSLKAGANLVNTQRLVWVVQSILSVNPNCPGWSDCRWDSYGKCIAKWERHPARVGRGSDAPCFSNIDVAADVMLAITKEFAGKSRHRLIARYRSTLEQLVMGDDVETIKRAQAEAAQRAKRKRK